MKKVEIIDGIFDEAVSEEIAKNREILEKYFNDEKVYTLEAIKQAERFLITHVKR